MLTNQDFFYHIENLLTQEPFSSFEGIGHLMALLINGTPLPIDYAILHEYLNDNDEEKKRLARCAIVLAILSDDIFFKIKVFSNNSVLVFMHL